MFTKMRKNLLFLALLIIGMVSTVKAQTPITSFFEGFEDGTLGIMTTIDADGDGRNWMNSSTLQAQGDGHNESLRYAYSESWGSLRPPLNPDNYIVTPQIAVTETSMFNFFVCSDWYAYVGEHYGVAISTAGNTDPDDFVTIGEWTLTEKGTRDDDQGPWREHNIDLSPYAGQNIYVAIRHFDCSNIYCIDIDDVSVTTEEGGCDAPANFNGILNGSSISLSWDAAEDAVSYNVYHSDTGDDYELIANVTENNYEEDATENSTYYYQVTAVYADGCESAPAMTAEGEDFIMFEVGDLAVTENGIGASLYPNPSNGAFNINCQGITRITVYGMRGETITDVNINADSHVITGLNAGVYFIKIETAKGSMTQKIVKF